MLEFNGGILINASQIVTAEFDQFARTLKLTFSVAVNIPQRVPENPNQALFEGFVAENLWLSLSKDSQKVRDELPNEPIMPFVLG